jgi:hypothetical protein
MQAANTTHSPLLKNELSVTKKEVGYNSMVKHRLSMGPGFDLQPTWKEEEGEGRGREKEEGKVHRCC